MITLKQLKYLTALAEHRHFGKAAEACSVTQPALSMQINSDVSALAQETEANAMPSRNDASALTSKLYASVGTIQNSKRCLAHRPRPMWQGLHHLVAC